MHVRDHRLMQCCACLQTFKLWHKRDVLATKILEPHLENLQTNPVIKAPVVEAAQPLVYPAPQLPLFGAAKPIEPEQTEDFGCAPDSLRLQLALKPKRRN